MLAMLKMDCLASLLLGPLPVSTDFLRTNSDCTNEKFILQWWGRVYETDLGNWSGNARLMMDLLVFWSLLDLVLCSYFYFKHK